MLRMKINPTLLSQVERCIAQLVELAVHDLWLGRQAMDPGLNPARGHLFHPLSLPVLSLSLQ